MLGHLSLFKWMSRMSSCKFLMPLALILSLLNKNFLKFCCIDLLLERLSNLVPLVSLEPIFMKETLGEMLQTNFQGHLIWMQIFDWRRIALWRISKRIQSYWVHVYTKADLYEINSEKLGTWVWGDLALVTDLRSSRLRGTKSNRTITATWTCPWQ